MALVMFAVLTLNVHMSVAEDALAARLKSTFERAKAGRLEPGMTAAQLEQIVGKPDNGDWNFSFQSGKDKVRVWLRVETHGEELKSWRDFVTDRHRFGSFGYFFVLANDRLVTPVPALTSKDFESLANLAKNADASSDSKSKRP